MTRHGRTWVALVATSALTACAAAPDDGSMVASTTVVATTTRSVAATPTVATTSVVTESTTVRLPTLVVLVGDSLALEAAQYLPALLQEQRFEQHTFGGTAPCDWLTTDLAFAADSVVLFSFLGNSSSACMASSGQADRVAATIERYRTDLATLVTRATSTGAAVVLLGQPPVDRHNVEGNALVVGLNDLYQQFALQPGVSFMDAGAALENEAGEFAERLPCRPNEEACDANGTIVVRSDDGVHFCPGEYVSPCPSYSSGAARYAEAIAVAAQDPSRFD